MPRRARLVVAGIPLHIVQRGHNRLPCFFDGDDYRVYLRYLGENSIEHGCSIHAYVLMTNHVHLLVTPEAKESASLMMKCVGQRYVRYINKKHSRSGTLWEGRFRSCLTQTDNYVLACYRYIELNPVRAKIVDDPKKYYWSSYMMNAYGWKSEIVTPHSVFVDLSADAVGRMQAYRKLVSDGLNDDLLIRIREATNSNTVLGNVRFRERIGGMFK